MLHLFKFKSRKIREQHFSYKTIKPIRQRLILVPITWLLSIPCAIYHRLKINKKNMKGLKPPYILLSTHMGFDDFKVMTMAIMPYRANYVVAIDGFVGIKWLLEQVGGISKRKFTNDTLLVRHLHHVLQVNKNIAVIYPEARYSISGTTAILPESLGKLVKLNQLPVVVLNCHGHHLANPFWSKCHRYVRYISDMEQIINQTEVSNLSLDEINSRIEKAFYYDEWKWQKDNHIVINTKNRASGLHKVLYVCPNCQSESKMKSEKHLLFCPECGKKWEMTEWGELRALDGETAFSHIPDWYEWIRRIVAEEVKSGNYFFEDEVRIYSLPNPYGYIYIGKATLQHSKEGFRLFGTLTNGDEIDFSLAPSSTYSIHIEYEHLKRGDCVDLSDLNNTYFVYPTKQNVVTKIHFAVEEIYKQLKEKPANSL